ncbi:hypothetical protein DCO46_20680 [Flavobacterium sp. HTF]|nr:hypothetical protein DCO46_20680 [Flavobacterium sp. HTF]
MKNVLNLILLLFVSTYCCGQKNNISKMVEEYAVKNHFNGTVLVQNNHKIFYHKIFGLQSVHLILKLLMKRNIRSAQSQKHLQLFLSFSLLRKEKLTSIAKFVTI